MCHAESLCFAHVFSNDVSRAQTGGQASERDSPHHHEHKVPGGKKGLWHQSDLQVLGKISECGEMARVKEGGGGSRAP